MRSALRKVIVGALDRPGGRAILSSIATMQARREAREDVQVFFDDTWIYQLDGFALPVSTRFARVRGDTLRQAQHQMESNAADYWYHVYTPSRGDTIIDVGAGVGSDSIVFSHSVGSTGRVLAVEAHPVTFKLLQKCKQWNGLDNTILCHCAVMDRPGFVYIDSHISREENAVTLEPGPNSFPRAIPAFRLDDLCATHQIERVDFLKMNIEGAERYALPGMVQTLSRCRYVCIACHDFLSGANRALETKDLVTAALQRHGFDTVIRHSDQRVYVRDHVHGIRRR